MFVIGNDQGSGICRWVQDQRGKTKEARGHLIDGHRGGAEHKTDRLMAFGIEAEESVRDLVRAYCLIVPVARHLTFTRAGQTVRVDGQEATWKVAAGPTDAAQGELKVFGVRNGMGEQQIVNALIGGHEGQAIEEFEALLTEGSRGSQVHNAQGGFVDQLHRHAGGKVGWGGAGPACYQIPGAQAQVFRSQQPEANKVSGNLIRQQLADAAFDAEVIVLFAPILSKGAMGFHLYDRALRMELVEFFFEARIGR